jgi:hypothetical protein
MHMTTQVQLSIDPSLFQVRYEVGGHESPTYQVLPEANGASPFNTSATPFLLPSSFGKFYIIPRVNLGPANGPVYWGVRVQFFTESNQVIPCQGFSDSLDLDHLNGYSGVQVQPNGHDHATFFPIDSIDPAVRPNTWQPEDLPASQSVRLSIAALAFGDAKGQQPIPVSGAPNNAVDFWLMHV